MRYDPITEKPYCCVAAVLQMIMIRRGLRSMSQDEIGWELGLIVPPEIKSQFTKVRTGPMPPAGYGTQTSKPEFSIENYFNRHRLPLSITRVSPSSLKELISTLKAALDRDNDVVLCFNSQRLFGEGDIEHAALIEAFHYTTGQVTVVDPAIGAPKHRIAAIDRIFETIQAHDVSALGGLWIISDYRARYSTSSSSESVSLTGLPFMLLAFFDFSTTVWRSAFATPRDSRVGTFSFLHRS